MRNVPKPFKERLPELLTDEEMEHARRSYDVVGDIALVEVPEELEHKKQEIGEALLASQKRIKVVLRKSISREGEYRQRLYEHLAGEERTTTLHKESGCRFRLDVEKTYFSVRESTERLRISELVEDGERVLVMFSGIAPFGIVIAKKNEAEVVCVEHNPDAHEMALENIELNKVGDRVEAHLGDVREVVPGLGEFDRVLMPSPTNAHEYLDVAINAVKEGGIVHFYTIAPEEDMWSEAIERLEKAARAANRTAEVVNRHHVLPYAPRVEKVCVDAEIR